MRPDTYQRVLALHNWLAGMLLVCWMLVSPLDGVAQTPDFGLKLPAKAVAARTAKTTSVPAGQRVDLAKLEGPGCIRHIWMTTSREDLDNRNAILRIYFDGEEIPFVEAPLGDFFAVMHGKAWYPINTPLISVQAKSGYNCYFPMPFARSARVELEAGPRDSPVYSMVDWHQYPEQPLEEPMRFCARWRRENPTQRYGEDFLMLDATGPGRLVGFAYGVRLIDNVDRWSHGGSDNIYLDGDGRYPSYLRGIGGEDTFGTSYGGSLHTPRTHLFAEMAYYEQVDDGTARPAKEIGGYRWFINDAIVFEKSIHMRFGCMENDICSTVYWYQQGPLRPFSKLPSFAELAPGQRSVEIRRGKNDLPLPDSGQWWLKAPSDNAGDKAITAAAKTPLSDLKDWKSAGWKHRAALHGFIDVNHAGRPSQRAVGVHYVDVIADARCTLDAPQEMTAKFLIGWEDRLVLRVNDQPPRDLGHRDNFGSTTVEVPLKAGKNVVQVTLSNTRNYNHGGWAFSLLATDPAGKVLLPQRE